jgi:hypothetical protein
MSFVVDNFAMIPEEASGKTYSSPCSAFKSASNSFEISSKKRKASRFG